MHKSVEDMHQVFEEADCLYPASAVEGAIVKMAEQMSADLKDSNPIMFPIMTGGLIFSGKLLTSLVFPMEVDYIHATRYRGQTTGGDLHWKVAPSESVKGRTVVLLDDILDEGGTLAAIKEYCEKEGAKEVKVAVLVEKIHNRKSHPDLCADYLGIEVEDRYLFGYGMDYKGYWRNAPGIYAVKGL